MTPHTLTCTVKTLEIAQQLSDTLEGCVDSLTFFEDPQGWLVTINHTVETPEILGQIVGQAANVLGISLENVDCQKTPAVDWLVENRRAFPPIPVGDFFIYSSFFEDALPGDKHAIKLDAATAFGTGEHPTTAGCLEVMSDLYADGFRPERVLDMGCGSGILAIGAAKLWRVPTLAVDNDPEAVRVARENCQENDVSQTVTCSLGDGYEARVLAPFYDLIIANILANPLCEMAGDLAKHLSPEGHVILSGILNTQAQTVIDAHGAKKLSLVHQIVRGDWTILHLKSSRR